MGHEGEAGTALPNTHSTMNCRLRLTGCLCWVRPVFSTLHANTPPGPRTEQDSADGERRGRGTALTVDHINLRCFVSEGPRCALRTEQDSADGERRGRGTALTVDHIDLR